MCLYIIKFLDTRVSKRIYEERREKEKKKHKLRCRSNRVILLVVKCLITYSSFPAKMSFLLLFIYFFKQVKEKKNQIEIRLLSFCV
jgi:hypothetical protein